MLDRNSSKLRLQYDQPDILELLFGHTPRLLALLVAEAIFLEISGQVLDLFDVAQLVAAD